DSVVHHLRTGELDQAERLALQAARRRGASTDPARLMTAGWVPLNDGPGTVTALCLPPLPAPPFTGPAASPYRELAGHLAGTLRLWSVSLPGYAHDPLPADLPAALEALAHALPEPRPDRPYLLLRPSPGGTLAHALAQTILRRHPLDALVLLDSPRDVGATPEEVSQEVVGHITSPAGRPQTAEHLTAMYAYIKLLSGQSCADTGVPTLYLHP